MKFLDEAVTEAHNAWQWYRDRSERAGEHFERAFEEAIAKISEDPDRWPHYLLGTKYVSLKRFPYVIVFREVNDEPQVVAVAHAKRRRGYWRKRVR